jgi:hypothetical protein
MKVSDIYGLDDNFSELASLEERLGHHPYKRPRSDSIDRCYMCGRNDRPGDFVQSFNEKDELLDVRFACNKCMDDEIRAIEAEERWIESDGKPLQ